MNTGPRSPTAELALVAIRREYFDNWNDNEGTERADIKAFNTAPPGIRLAVLIVRSSLRIRKAQ